MFRRGDPIPVITIDDFPDKNRLAYLYYNLWFVACSNLAELADKAHSAFKDRGIYTRSIRITAFKQALLIRATEIDFDKAELFVSALSASLILES